MKQNNELNRPLIDDVVERFSDEVLDKILTDFKTVIDAYTSTDESLFSTAYLYLPLQGSSIHCVKNKLQTKEGEAFAKFIHHLALINHPLNSFADAKSIEEYIDLIKSSFNVAKHNFKKIIEKKRNERLQILNDNFQQNINGAYKKRLVEYCESNEINPYIENEKKRIEREINLLEYNQSNLLNELYSNKEKENSQQNNYSYTLGQLTAFGVGLAEATVSSVPAGAAIYLLTGTAYAAIPYGIITFISGFVLNRTLLLQPSIGLWKTLLSNEFDKDVKGNQLVWYKSILNYLFATLAFMGTGVVFASVFTREFLQMFHGLLSTLGPVWQSVALIAGPCIAAPFALAELFGISALLHMANKKVICGGIDELTKSIINYLYKNFYVPMPSEWNSFEGFGKNLLQILQHSPRFIVSTAFTLLSTAVVLYYMKMTFVFFAACVSGLVAGLPFIGAAAAINIGLVTSGINAITTFMTFTLPLGQLLHTSLQFSLNASLVALSQVVALLLLPLFLGVSYYNDSVSRDCVEQFFINFFKAVMIAGTWLNSQSLVVPGGYELYSKEAPKKEYQEECEKPNFVRIQKAEQKARSVYSGFYLFYLFNNSLVGQTLLFLSNGNTFNTSFRALFEGGIFGVRSFAMNKLAVDENVELEAGSSKLVMC